jgi:ATP-binding cassette subfamily F protein 3
MLFRGDSVKKKISVLSGGERARLCLAGLLLSNYNVLVLDEPGNHLDVDTVEALADALCAYQGTIVFTSHDRHFMKRVATCIIEVRDGRVVNYRGDYDAYLYAVNKEIDEGERAEAQLRYSAAPAAARKSPGPDHRAARRGERELRKEMAALERTIGKLDEQKRDANRLLLAATDPAEALRLHNEVADLTEKLAEAEESWLRVQQELGE